MRFPLLPFCLVVALAYTGTAPVMASSGSSVGQPLAADRVLRGGSIEWMKPDQPTSEAVAMRDGKITGNGWMPANDPGLGEGQ